MSLLSTAPLAFAAVFGVVWVSHRRAAKRLTNVLDAYAEREMQCRTPRLSGPGVTAGGSVNKARPGTCPPSRLQRRG
jgi:hypothetical protein